MEISPDRWLSELGMDDPTFIHQCQMNYSLDEFTTLQTEAVLEEDFQDSFSSESYPVYPIFNPKNTTTTAFSASSMETSPKASSSPYLLSFTNSDSPTNPQQFYRDIVDTLNPKDKVVVSPENVTLSSNILISQGSHVNQNHVTRDAQGVKRSRTTTRPPSQAQDHIIAERKRRENLSQQFIALSAIVPGLKKMDKASVLGDTIKYLKQLKDQLKTLEEQTVKKTVESVVFVKKSQVSTDDDDTSSCDESFNGPLPEIEARVCDNKVLIRIYCEKSKGVLVKALTEIEELHLTVVNSSSVMPFGSSAIDITIVAQMDLKFCMTVKDLVRKLRSSFGQCMREEEDGSSVHV